jgi:hypothetical protein
MLLPSNFERTCCSTSVSTPSILGEFKVVIMNEVKERKRGSIDEIPRMPSLTEEGFLSSCLA